jgi:hypothetical protein
MEGRSLQLMPLATESFVVSGSGPSVLEQTPSLAASQYPPYNMPAFHLQHPKDSHSSLDVILCVEPAVTECGLHAVHFLHAVTISNSGTRSLGSSPTPPQGMVHF